MHIKRLAFSATMAAGLALGMGSAWCAGFGPASTSAVLGRVLDFDVALRLEPGEEIEPRCVRAEVTVGDRELPVGLISTAIERTSASTVRVRVRTGLNVDEPVVGVLLHVGCQARLSRRFVLLADPPGMAMPATAPPSVMVAAAALPPAAPLEVEPMQAAPAQTASRGAARARAAGASPGASASSRAERPASRPAAKRPESKRANVRSAPPARRAVARLQLDAPATETGLSTAEMLVIEQALQAVADAASAVQGANQAAAAAEQRAQDLARTVEQLRADKLAQIDASAMARERLQAAQARSNWVWPLLLGMLVLAALAGWLAWQLAALRREQQRGWQTARAAEEALAAAVETEVAAKSPTVPQPFVTSAAPAVRQPPPPAWPPPAPVEPQDPRRPAKAFVASDFAPVAPLRAADIDLPVGEVSEPPRPMERTLPFPLGVHTPAQEVPMRDLSIEELIDLEQQAEFFIVLGQDEAAIELLVEHIRSTGGGSPLPYLKLLEIYHRVGDREAFERTRQRFNQRFNAYAAEWGTNLEQGLGLQDYPGVLPRLVQVWPRPIDAMAELEVLLFRKSRGELFDLPAYREVLFLYALARDLLDREAADTGNVDLLLPLADGGEFSVTAPHPYFGLDHDSVFDSDAAEGRPTSPVDLDLSQGDADRPTRIVDPLPARKPL